MTSPQADCTRADREAIVEAAKKALEQGEAMLTPEEAARAIGCGERWLRDGANRRGFPHHRFGKFLRFSLQDCREIQEMNRERARPSELAKARRRKSGRATSSGTRSRPVA
ncbi:helix-turn-helix domain-containing protein [Streptomyces sp. MMS24-I29]|uniref:helix-turn-helix domain-containing protein n=1 Tax=Streptomyces sp. MMS24-I29 TaxID=3351480 RepID=UPI003C7CA6A2